MAFELTDIELRQIDWNALGGDPEAQYAFMRWSVDVIYAFYWFPPALLPQADA